MKLRYLPCAIILLSMGASASAAPAADTPWHWVWLAPTEKGWQMQEGDAPVTFSGDRFASKLEGHASVLVEGRIRDGKIEATIVQEGTDAAPRRYVGEIRSSYSKPSDPAHGWGDDRISLRDHDFFLGFHRVVRRVARQP